MKISLKVKLMVSFFLFITIPLAALGVYSYIDTSRAIQSSIEQQLKKEGDSTADYVNQAFDSVNNYINIVSLNQRVEKLAAGDKSQSNEVYQYLSELQKQNSSQIKTLIVTDASGKEIASNEQQNTTADLSSEEYVKAALGGTASQSDITVSKDSGDVEIAIAYPLKNEGKIVGTVIGTINFKNVCKYVSTVKTGKNGFAYLVDKDGLIIYHPDSTKVLKENITKINNNDLNNLFSKAKAGSTIDGHYTASDGVYKYAYFVPMKNWILVVTANYNEYMTSAFSIRNTTILFILISSLLSVILSYFLISRNVIKAIKKLESLMVKAGNGDLSIKSEIKTGDEIQTLGENFNIMVEHLRNLISNIRGHADELAASSQEMSASCEEMNASTEEITANIQEVAKNAENQSELVTETSGVLVQLSSLVQIAQNKSITAKTNSENALNVAQNGRYKVEETVGAIENISRATEETENALKLLDDLSKKINGITSTINGISEQTNLLALNAAIEAARAGEHGKGFTVVADEVRKLSEETSNGSKEIASLINEMIAQIKIAVESMDSGKDAVENGVVVANETDSYFVNIMNAVEQVVKDIERIADVTKDEVSSSDQIINLIDSVATITETTTSSSEEVASASEESAAVVQNVSESAQRISEMAVDMDDLVEKFNL